MLVVMTQADYSSFGFLYLCILQVLQIGQRIFE
jgi:hypothetical protein